MTWVEWLRELLCRLYKTWGGDCADLGMVPNPAIPRVREVFDAQGLPPMDEKQRAEFVATLVALEAHLKLKDNNLPKLYQDMLDQLIADLWAALGE